MLEDFLGKETFRKGLNHYLKSHAYGNAAKEDLWNALDRAARKGGGTAKAAVVVKDWVNREGYPYIKVEQSRGKLKLTQHRFTLLDRKSSDHTWSIPVHYSTSSRNKPSGRLLFASRSLSINSREPVVKLNADQAGFYRTLYTEEKLDELGELIKGSEMPWADPGHRERPLCIHQILQVHP